MTLRDLIARLEAEDPRKVCPYGFARPHSWRYLYRELAFEPVVNISVGEMLAAARSADGSTYQGWKGGYYQMSLDTAVHFALEGECDEPDIPGWAFAGNPILARCGYTEVMFDGSIFEIDAGGEDPAGIPLAVIDRLRAMWRARNGA